ncbi:hypothetical protein BH18GEM1_BH18GEM1_00730 [soil metagenome]
MIGLLLAAALSVGPSVDGVSVRGRVVTEGQEPLAGVRIEIAAERIVVWSDSTGSYEIKGLRSGQYAVRFSQFGYHPMELNLTVPEEGSLSLDVRLLARPIALPRISIQSSAATSHPSAVFEPDGLPEVGSRVLPGEALWEDPLSAQPDVLGSLAVIPGIDMAEESPTQFHVRGGSADQNLILLDGLPLYNSYHSSGIQSAISPDAVSHLVVHTGVFPARYGGRLSSVVDVSTRQVGREGVRVRGGAGLADVRMTIEAPLPRGVGGLLMGGRRTTYDLISRGHADESSSSGFEEWLGKASFEHPLWRLDFVSLHSDNWLSSHADGGGDGEAAAPGGGQVPVPHNSVQWSSGTDGISWTRSLETDAEIQFRLWRATTNSDFQWGSGPQRHRAVNSLEHWGISGEGGWARPASVGRLGFMVEHLSSFYRAEREGEEGRPLSLGSDPTIASAFLEHRWIPRDQWMVSNGVRAVFVDGLMIEPRLSVHFRPIQVLTLSGGYARVHQFVHSLRNEESLLNAAFGFEPLVSVGAGGVEVGRSDQFVTSLEAELSTRLLLTIDAHTRWLDDIVLVAPVTAQPFVTQEFEQGTGRASGMGARLFYAGDRTDAQMILEWGRAVRKVGGIVYDPEFERHRSATVAASYRLTPQTRVRTAFQAAAGRPTSPVGGGFAWEPFDALSGEVEFAGTPLRDSESVNEARLPSYVRWDLGIRREWSLAILGRPGRVSAYLDVTNVLGRRNVLGYQVTPSAPVRNLSLQPVSALFGFEWSF